MIERRKISLEEAISIGQKSHREGELEKAESIYTQILAKFPEQEEALNFLGILRFQQGRSDEAVKLLERAVAAAPEYADAHNNLGNVFKKTGQIRKAAEAYRKALRLNPDHVDAFNNYGVMLRQADHPKEAEEAFTRCLELDPHHLSARRNIADLLRRDKRPLEAVTHYRKLLELDPDNPVLSYLVDVCDPNRNPNRTPDAYVRAEFDAFAADFDNVLKSLKYRAPWLIDELLGRQLGPPRGELEVLDAGCGTGLSATLLGPRASRLVGVDISEKMLDKARERGGYDELVPAEITAYMEDHPERFDLVASADTLCYFGDLEGVVAAAASALRPGGVLTFTVEKADEAKGARDYELKQTGRYVHQRDYVVRTLRARGLDPEHIEDVVLREEAGEPVAGFLVLARRRG